jgi:hypothetical protein
MLIDPTDPTNSVATTLATVMKASSSSGGLPLRIVAPTAVFALIAFLLVRRGAVG